MSMKQYLCCLLFKRKRKKKVAHKKNIVESKPETPQQEMEKIPENEEKVETALFDVLNTQVLQYLSKYIGKEWELLAFNLGLSRDEVAKANADNLNSHRKRVYQILTTWYNKHLDDRKRMSSFIRAFETCGRKDLAQKVHCAQWADQEFEGFEMPSSFPMLIRIDKNRPQPKHLFFPKVNDLNPTTARPVHSKSPRFIILSG